MLRKKMFRDIFKHKIQFLSIFLMVFLGSFVYAGVSAEYIGMETIAENFYDDTNAANIWVYGSNFSEENLKEIEELDRVTGIEKRLELSATMTMEGNPSLKLNAIDDHKISQAYIMEGDAYDKDNEGIYLSEMFADAHNIKVGDTIEFEVMGMKLDYKVSALITAPDYVYYIKEGDLVPNHNNYGYAYISKDNLPEAVQSYYSELLITTDTDDYKDVVNEIEDVVNGEASAIVTRDEHSSYNTLASEVAQHEAMGSIFPIAFLLIAVLSVLTTMIRLISSQRPIISTLKALGFKKRKILFHYLSYGFVISLAGAVLGVIVGPLTLPYLFYPSMSSSFALPSWSPILSWSFLGLPMLLVLVCTFITYLVCRSYVKESPAQGMRLQATKKMKKSVVERIWFWKHLGFSNQWNLRDIFRNKARSAMAIVGIAGCTGLLVCAFGILDSMNNFMDWQFRDLSHYKTQLKLDETVTSEQLINLDDSLTGEFIMEQAIEIKADDQRRTGSVSVYEDDYELSSVLKSNKEVINLKDGDISISKKMANLLGVEEGDKISWRIYGGEEWISSTITYINYSPTAQGISMNQTTLEDNDYTFYPSIFVTNDKVDDSYDGVSSIWSQSQLETEMDERLEMMNLLVYILALAAILMALIVLYCLGIISFMEKYRDFATLKVLGFKTKKIRWLLIQQNLYLAVVGIPFGFLFGAFLIKVIMADMGDAIDILMYISPQTWILCGAMTFVITMVISIMFSRRAKKIDMVAALKANE